MTLSISRAAAASLAELAPGVRRAAAYAILALLDDPHGPGTARMTNHPYWYKDAAGARIVYAESPGAVKIVEIGLK
ncbi:MAG: hypothetical protein HY804_10645 [Nitrospinae bacterium]|nr:hypothetical protein [Nitrospinota bacterium]